MNHPPLSPIRSPFVVLLSSSLLAFVPASESADAPCPPRYETVAQHALQGDRSAVSLLGPCYTYSREQGLPLEQASDSVRTAAERGLAAAQFVWGMMLLTGAGATEDTAAAMVWIQRAAAQGNQQAASLMDYVLNHDEPLAC